MINKDKVGIFRMGHGDGVRVPFLLKVRGHTPKNQGNVPDKSASKIQRNALDWIRGQGTPIHKGKGTHL